MLAYDSCNGVAVAAEYGSAERYRRSVRTFSLKSNPLRLSCDEIPAFGEKLYAERGKTVWKEKRAFVIHPVVVNLQIYTAALAGRDYGQFGENGACGGTSLLSRRETLPVPIEDFELDVYVGIRPVVFVTESYDGLFFCCAQIGIADFRVDLVCNRVSDRDVFLKEKCRIEIQHPSGVCSKSIVSCRKCCRNYEIIGKSVPVAFDFF